MGKTLDEQIHLQAKLALAKTQVAVGTEYRHFKATHKIYTVLTLAFQEDTDELCVIYQATYGERLTFIRPLVSWLETVEWEGKTVPRFTKI